MRILFFVHRYWPDVGGVEKYIHRLARALYAMGHEVHVLAGVTRADWVPSEDHEGVSVHRFPMYRSPFRARCWILRNIRLLQNADVIHVSNTHMLEFFWRMVGGLISRRKVFLTRHGMSYLYPVPDWEKRRAVRSLRLAAGVVHDGAFIQKWLELEPDLCPDQGLFPPADELTPQPEPPPNSAIYIGRLEPDSGIRIYLDAVEHLNRSGSRPFRLDVYGDGSLGPSLEARIRREQLPVVFHGRVPDAQNHITDGCFAFIDGRMAIQEAMARRRLVLPAYPDPLKRDYVGTESFSPYVVPVADGVDLARRVVHYIERPGERCALVERAFGHARTLTWERTARAYLGFWVQRLARPVRGDSRWAMIKTALALHHEASLPKATWAR